MRDDFIWKFIYISGYYSEKFHTWVHFKKAKMRWVLKGKPTLEQEIMEKLNNE